MLIRIRGVLAIKPNEKNHFQILPCKALSLPKEQKVEVAKNKGRKTYMYKTYKTTISNQLLQAPKVHY